MGLLYGTDSITLSDDNGLDTSKVEEAFFDAAKFVHQKGHFAAESLKEPSIGRLISATTDVLSQAVTFGFDDKRNVELKQQLTENIHVFSSFKTFHEMKEAAHLLVDNQGSRKPFNQYLNDVQTLNKTYNKQYLKAEYDFTTASAQMAAKWNDLAEDEERYNLQYRTVGDSKVRKSHAALNGITLPASDPFWDEFYPPNGFRCRCSVSKVRKSKYPESDKNDAVSRGREATSGKHQEMFRFNPGKRKAIYPPHNTYTVAKCNTCSKNGYTLAKVPGNELCQACGVIKSMKHENEKSRKKYDSYDEQKWERKYYNSKNGGYLVTDKSRQEYGNRNKQEKAKYDKEHEMCLTYARAGYRIEHLGETPGVSSPDVTINGIYADLKRTKGSGNIVKYARKAVHQQGAEMVLFQFDEWGNEFRKQLLILKKEGIKAKYIITGEDRVHTL